ncbi:MAG: hypothetical protein WBW33_07530 [Bryobacteraceae bacterium]
MTDQNQKNVSSSKDAKKSTHWDRILWIVLAVTAVVMAIWYFSSARQ